MDLFGFFKKKEQGETKDILLKQKEDRRLLSKVPDKEAQRTNLDRRRVTQGEITDFAEHIYNENQGIRYMVDFPVNIIVDGKKKDPVPAKAVDISSSGLLVSVNITDLARLDGAEELLLKFEITPGSMPEGYEMKVKIKAKPVRTMEKDDGTALYAMLFTETLAQYANKSKNFYLLTFSSIFLFMVAFFIFMMRAESVLYFKFNKSLYAYSIVAATFLLTRYFFSMFYKTYPIDPNYTPGVTILIPCFNEEEWIERTILSCINQDYPIDRLEVILVDDCSTDSSYEKAANLIDHLKATEKRFNLDNRLHYMQLEHNKGKRDALAEAAVKAQHDIVAFVDSDSFLDPFAIRNLVQPFVDNRMGGVSGRTDVANTYTNSLTKMQSVRYFIAFRVMKAAESYFDSVTCLSGPLAAYRKDLLMENLEAWITQSFFGEKATFGDDRAMTNMMLRNWRTCYQDTAICSTIVPNTHRVFLKQQMRWKRSWLRESMIAGTYMWRKEPFMALSFYMGLIIPFFAPIIVIYNLIYIPLIHRVFPSTFLVGLLLMAMLMSMAQLFLRKSSTWLFGLWFVLYYEFVLLWQMPVAWFTFWKSTWGTRMTPADVAELERKTGTKFVADDEEADKVLDKNLPKDVVHTPEYTIDPVATADSKERVLIRQDGIQEDIKQENPEAAVNEKSQDGK